IGNRRELLYIRILPIADAPIYCSAILNSVYKQINETWELTALSEALDLQWSNRQYFGGGAVQPGVKQFIDVFRLENGRPTFQKTFVTHCVHSLQNRASGVFVDEGIYRCDVILVTASGSNVKISIGLEVKHDWKSSK